MIIALYIITFFALVINIGTLVRWKTAAKKYPRLINTDIIVLEQSVIPKVSVIIPVRDEQENIRECLSSLLNQDYHSLEIIVVDDQSIDNTPEILESFARDDKRLILLKIQNKPETWAGKTFALTQGVSKASGDYLLFLDADTFFEQGFIKSAINYMLETGTQVLTFAPKPVFLCFWDRLVMPFLGQRLCENVRKVNDPDCSEGGVNGAFILFKREDYFKIGGFQSVSDNILEDQIIGQNAKSSGRKVGYVFAQDFISQKLYGSLNELREALARPFIHSKFKEQRKIIMLFPAPILTFLIYSVYWIVPILFIPQLLFPNEHNEFKLALFFLAISGIIVSVIAQKEMHKYMKIEKLNPFMQPLAAAVLSILLVDVILKLVTGHNPVWKGRKYSKKKTESVR